MKYAKEKESYDSLLPNFLWEVLFWLESCTMGTILLKTFGELWIKNGKTFPTNLYFVILLIFWVLMYIVTIKYISVKPKDLLLMLIAVVIVGLFCYFVLSGSGFPDILDVIGL